MYTTSAHISSPAFPFFTGTKIGVAEGIRECYNLMKEEMDMSAQWDASLRAAALPANPVEARDEAKTLLMLLENSSQNTNAVATLDKVFSDPPRRDELEALRQKLNELIRALRR
jgi:hypothetical protein